MSKYKELNDWFLSHYNIERTFDKNDLLLQFTQLVDRATPMKPKTSISLGGEVCGNCGYEYYDIMQSDFGQVKSNYCPNCGQALDWSDDE